MKRRTKIVQRFPLHPAGRIEKSVEFEVLDGYFKGQRLRLVVEKTRRVRIPYKPRGTFGWERAARIADASGKTLATRSSKQGFNLKDTGCDVALGWAEDDVPPVPWARWEATQSPEPAGAGQGEPPDGRKG